METDKLSYIDDIGKYAADTMRIQTKTNWASLSAKLNASPKGFSISQIALAISSFVVVASIAGLLLFTPNQKNQKEKFLNKNIKNEVEIDTSTPYSVLHASKPVQKNMLPYDVFKPTVLTKIKIVRKQIIIKRKIYITDTIHIKK